MASETGFYWVRVRSFPGRHFPALGLKQEDTEYLSVFIPNEGKNGPEKLRIRTLFTLFFFIEKKIKEWYVDKEETIW